MRRCKCGARILPGGDRRHCSDCHQELPAESFHHHPSSPDGRRGKCTRCEARAAEERAERNPEAGARRSAAWRQRHPLQAKLGQIRARAKLPPEVIAAQLAVRQAIRTGKLVRATACAHCGGDGGGKIEAAHVDYTRPLDIVWLCTRCHRKWDARSPKHVAH